MVTSSEIVPLVSRGNLVAEDRCRLPLAEPVGRGQPELVEHAALDPLHLEVPRVGRDRCGVSLHLRVRDCAEPADRAKSVSGDLHIQIGMMRCADLL